MTAPFRLRPSLDPPRSHPAQVSLPELLSDLDRVATPVEPPTGSLVKRALAWEPRDNDDPRWYPQGITTSADAAPAAGAGEPGGDQVAGRDVLLVSWYARGAWGRTVLGSRISVVDVTDTADGGPARYRHVLLVEPVRRAGVPGYRPVRVHAGGLVWHGDHLLVAGSRGGLRVFSLADLRRVRRPLTPGSPYVLVQRGRLDPDTDPDVPPLTYSFLSLDRSGESHHLLAGEYGRTGGQHRLARYLIDPRTGLPEIGTDGHAHAVEWHDRQVPRMQGATTVGETWVVTASTGEGNPGDLWTGRPGALVRHRGVLPTGPEDITHWPRRGELWLPTEWPGRRLLCTIAAARLP